MKKGKQFLHGKHLDFDTHIANGSLRIAKTPPGHAYIEHEDGTKEFLPDDPKRFSYVTPQNPGSKDWEDGTSKHYNTARKSFDVVQLESDFEDKLNQIKLSCPECSALIKEENK